MSETKQLNSSVLVYSIGEIHLHSGVFSSKNSGRSIFKYQNLLWVNRTILMNPDEEETLVYISLNLEDSITSHGLVYIYIY